ncbi:hypothetical protein GF377_00715 [candidate division GN15 bacterium]|nr:hypothetical protein [candidate division GN15 bacterium]
MRIIVLQDRVGSWRYRWAALLACVVVLASSSASGFDLPESEVIVAMDRELAARTWELAEAGRADDDLFPGEEKPPAAELEGDRTGRKSVFKAAALSALVPGGGQYYVGNKKTAYYFFAAEALTWIGYASFKIYSNWKEDDYIRYAAIHADARLEGKSDDFVDLVGFYDDIDQYNSLARAFDPEREYLRDTPENHWRWASDAERFEFRHLKNRSREADRRAEFMIGVAVVDRIISVIDAVRASRKHNRQMPTEFSDNGGLQYKFSVDPFSSSRQFSLTFYPGF